MLGEAEGSIYPLPGHLQRAGLVETFIMTWDETGRQRKYYRLTPEGAGAGGVRPPVARVPRGSGFRDGSNRRERRRHAR